MQRLVLAGEIIDSRSRYLKLSLPCQSCSRHCGVITREDCHAKLRHLTDATLIRTPEEHQKGCNAKVIDVCIDQTPSDGNHATRWKASLALDGTTPSGFGGSLFICHSASLGIVVFVPAGVSQNSQIGGSLFRSPFHQ